MQQTKNFGGIAILIGAALNLTRLFPILLNEQINFGTFPPETVAQVTETSLLPGWILSHVMGFLSVPLLIIGFITLFKGFNNRKQGNVGLAAIVFGSIGMLFYAAGVWIDGLLLPQTAEVVLTASAADLATAEMIQTFTHTMATTFGGLSLVGVLISVALFGFGLSNGYGRHTLGQIGVLYGVVGIIALTFGVIDVQMHDNFMLSAGYLFGAQAWLLAFGIRIIQGLEKQPQELSEMAQPA